MSVEELLNKIRERLNAYETAQDAVAAGIAYFELLKLCKGLLYRLAYLYASVDNVEAKKQLYNYAWILLTECKIIKFDESDWNAALKKMNALHKWHTKSHD